MGVCCCKGAVAVAPEKAVLANLVEPSDHGARSQVHTSQQLPAAPCGQPDLVHNNEAAAEQQNSEKPQSTSAPDVKPVDRESDAKPAAIEAAEELSAQPADTESDAKPEASASSADDSRKEAPPLEPATNGPDVAAATQVIDSSTSLVEPASPGATMQEEVLAVHREYVFGMGCFWGAEEVMRAVVGPGDEVCVGYSGGDVENPDHKLVSKGKTGHVEAVQVTLCPETKVMYSQLLVAFFTGHDSSAFKAKSQYRSTIFATKGSPEFEEAGMKLAQYDNARTVIVSRARFHKAEEKHQGYIRKQPGDVSCSQRAG